MIQFGISMDKRFYVSSGNSYAGEKGTTATVDLPDMLGGVALSAFDAGAVYAKYGTSGSEEYAEIELAALTGVQSIDIPDAVLAVAGTVIFWAEFTADSGNVVQKTALLPYIVGASETYSAPEQAPAENNGGGGEE